MLSHMWSKRKHFILYIYVLKLFMSFRMSKINSIGLFIAPYGRAIEEPKAVLTFNLCQLLIFFLIGCAKSDVIFVSVARNSRDLTSLELSPALHMFHCHMKQNHFFVKYAS